MKNLIYIDIDTEREQPILIGKGSEITPPQTAEEAKVMITNDIACLCEALCSLIHIADQSGYAKKEDLINVSVSQINTLLIIPTTEETQGDPSSNEPTTENLA